MDTRLGRYCGTFVQVDLLAGLGGMTTISQRLGKTARAPFLAFFVLGLVGLALRAARFGVEALSPLYLLANTDFSVAIEHLFAGFGMPGAFFSLLLLLVWTAERTGRKPLSVREANFAIILVATVASVLYVYFMCTHELKQAYVSVYGKAPREYVQYWQIASGIAGVAMFWLFIIRTWRRTSRCIVSECPE